MLVGTTVTLQELEDGMKKQYYKNKEKIRESEVKISELQKESLSINQFIVEENRKVYNPRIIQVANEFSEHEAKIKNILEDNDFIRKKLDELEDIESESLGEIIKSEKKITLTLNDSITFGIWESKD